VDAVLKGITGNLFGSPNERTFAANTQPHRAVPAKPMLPVPANPNLTSPASQPASQSSLVGAPARKLPAYYYRLPLSAQRVYLASDAIDRFALTPSPAAYAMVTNLMHALEGGAPSVVQRASQSLLNEVSRLLGVRAARIEVRSVRPHNSRGELHGLFYPRTPMRPVPANVGSKTAGSTAREPLIVLWMRTAQRHNVVAPRTFFRTLMHELGHHLDYSLLKLEDSYHSIGFYQRESYLVRTLMPAAARPAKSR
jgi:hypothetical protein